MIRLAEARMRYGARVLFDKLDWLITPGDRVGVVGGNGSGKSTLLKILHGSEHLDRGTIERQKGIKVGYLPQEGLAFSGRTVFEECLSVFDEAQALERELDELVDRMAEVDPASPEFQEVLDRYEWCSTRFQALDGYTMEARAGAVLGGLAFPKEDWRRPCEEFSGGWQMRVALAKLLLARPRLLLLDEPTNHLDLEARNWLEDFLRHYPHAFIVISHDRYFMDATVRKVVHLWNRRVHFYTGNYSKFEKLRDQRLAQVRAAYRTQQDRIEQLEVFINRFRYQATKARQVQSRIKELERMDRIEIPPEEKVIHFKFPQPVPSGRVVAELTDVAKSYGETLVFGRITLRIERGDRIALVGVNGAGKSTLIRILAGLEPLTAGVRRTGYRVGIDYFAQDQYKELDPEAILFEDLLSHAPMMGDTELRSLLGCFLFSGDDAFKRIGVLSGGERNRYALARMLLQPANLLLLDEPTNHLDLRAKDVLLRALLDFDGTMVFVSHDRYFIDQLANKVVHVGDGELEVFPGGYEDFLWSRQRRAEERVKPEAPVVSEQLGEALRQAAPAAPRRMNPIKVAKIRSRIGHIEQKIESLEESCRVLQLELATAGGDHARRMRVIEDLGASQRRMQRHEDEWAELSEILAAEGS
ncbi:MAG: ABC-F family ATP-binding cassette domain-containing protein [Bryobacterales bacterium]|nr:ABC-F family ATP-binding cassette domain-containing protein [Bryobacterales bacterium]MDE0625216.1 ABC-F family ATP-binding cassette domain-containing protein [Bryobacterales bacterium]